MNKQTNKQTNGTLHNNLDDYRCLAETLFYHQIVFAQFFFAYFYFYNNE